MMLIGGGLGVFDTAELHVVGNSSVYRNTCGRCYGAGVGMHGSAAKLLVSGGSRIERNNAGSGDGGGVFAGGEGVVVVRDGARLLNNSGSTGGAVFVDGNAQVTIMGNSVIGNNRPSYGGAGVCARDASRVALVGPVLLQGNRGINPGARGVVEGWDNVVVNLTGPVAFEDAFVDDGILYPIRRDKEAVIYAVAMYDNANLSIGAGAMHQGRTLTKCNNSIFLSREPCGAGEYQAVGSCQCCPPTTYGFEVNATVCMGCPPNADCPGGDVVWPLKGYWHSSSRSAQMHRCPLFTASCGDRGRCTEPYTGNLCGKCSPGYGVTQSLRCGKCIAFHRQLALYIALFVVTVVLVSYTVHATWHDNKAGDTALRPSDLIKVLVQFLQLLVIFGSISVFPRQQLLCCCGSLWGRIRPVFTRLLAAGARYQPAAAARDTEAAGLFVHCPCCCLGGCHACDFAVARGAAAMGECRVHNQLVLCTQPWAAAAATQGATLAVVEQAACCDARRGVLCLPNTRQGSPELLCMPAYRCCRQAATTRVCH